MSDIQLIPLVRVDQHKIALLFTNHLKHLNITAETIKDNGSFIIACDPEHAAQAQQLFEEFARQPYHPKYQQGSWQQGEVRENLGGQHSDLSHFKERFLSHAGVVTLVVFVLCWAVFLLSTLGAAQTLFNNLHFFPVLDSEAAIAEPWRFFTPAIFHFSWLHLIFNTLWWWQLGGDIESKLGKGTLLNILLLSAIVSNIAQYMVSGPNFGGLSGVVYALVGYCWWSGWLAPEKGLFLPRSLVGFMLVWLLLGYTSFMPINMANTAHLVGLICGCALAFTKHHKAFKKLN